MRRVTVVLACLSLLLLPLLSRADNADLVQAGSHGKKIANEYIVTLTDGTDVDTAADVLSKKHGGEVSHVYKNALKGFAMHVSDAEAAKIAKDDGVAGVFQDEEVSLLDKGQSVPVIQSQTLPTGIDRINAENKANVGTGIGVAVIDTGINLSHPDLSPVISGVTCVSNKRNATPEDDNGHGSHVAGTIAGRNNGIGVVGVAPGASLIAVKVLNAQGSGTWSQVICGIDWVTAHAAQYNIKVASMSLGGGGSAGTSCASSPMRQAICNSVNAGVTYIVAAGNSSANLSTSVPAAYPEVIAVTALADSTGTACGGGAGTSYGPDDTFATFSNFATAAADLARTIGAPGVNIYSTWKSGGYNTISGTSMATPHVSGAAALWIKGHPGATPAQVKAGLLAAAEPGNVNFNSECTSGVSHIGTALHPEAVLRAEGL